MRRARWLKALAGLAALLLGLWLAMWWLLGREATLHWALERVRSTVEGQIEVRGLTGNLLSGLRFERLSYTTESTRYVLVNGAVRWHLQPLRRAVILSRADLEGLNVEALTDDDEPPAIPESLTLPVSLNLEALRIGTIRFAGGRGDARKSAIDNDSLVLHDLFATLRYGTDQWTVSRLVLESPWGAAVAQGEVAASKPFAVRGSAELQGDWRGTAWRALLAVEGLLTDLTARATGTLGDGVARAEARLQPFEDQPLTRAVLELENVSPRQWDAALPEARISASIELAADAQEILQGQMTVANAIPGRLDASRLPLHESHAQIRIDVRSARTEFDALTFDFGPAGSLHGSAAVQARQSFLRLEVRTLDLRTVDARFASTRLNGALQARAAWPPVRESIWNADFDLQFGDSRYGTHRFAGHVRGSASRRAGAARLTAVDADLRMGENRLRAQGSLGDPDDRLSWRLELPRLADLGPGFGGSLQGSGTVQGTFEAPVATFEARASGLRLAVADGKDFRASVLTGSGRLGLGQSGPVEANLAAQGLQAGAVIIDKTEASINGTRAAHRATLAAWRKPNGVNDESLAGSLTAFELHFEASGALQDSGRWQGMVARLENRGNLPFRLTAPATLAVRTAEPRQVELGRAILVLGQEGQTPPARIEIESGRWRASPKGSVLYTAGKAEGVPLALAVLANPGLARRFESTLQSTLTFNAEWRLDLGEQADGFVRLERESGHLHFPEAPRVRVEFNRLEARLDMTPEAGGGAVRFRIDADGRELGKMSLEGGTHLSRRGGAWGFAGDAPLTLQSDLNLESIRWIGPLTGVAGLDIDGRLAGRVMAAGTLAAPVLSGQVHGDGLALRWPNEGLNYRNGTLDAVFQNDRLTLRQLRIEAGQGQANASGDLYLTSKAGPTGRIDWSLQRFQAIARPDRLVVASGTAAMQFDGLRIALRADLKADRGLVDLPEKGEVTLSNDIVILGRPETKKTVHGSPDATLDVRFDFGNDFRIRGLGLTGKLAGLLRIGMGQDRTPRASGSIRIEEGRYVAYGQQLTIRRGVLNFAGPLDNPGIDVVAVRAGPTVEAGVEVRGTAQAPRARLISTPNVPDAEKLSWLVLGHGMERSVQSEFALLSAAASGLLGSDGAPLQARIAGGLGVDDVNVAMNGNDNGERNGLVTVGKHISSRIYVSYAQGLNTLVNLLNVRYTITDRWSLRVQAGTENAVDVFYTLSFD